MPTTAVLVHDGGPPLAATPHFCVSLARSFDDLQQCQRLRYLVFNEELGEGLANSERDGLDRDEFDLICDHLMVYDATTRQLVGTYRLQTGYRAKGNLGYYGELLFEFAPLEPIRGEILELGRACVHQEFRSTPVLHMLWKGIARYAERCGARFLIGCSSLTSQDEREGTALYNTLSERYLAQPSLRTQPKPGFNCTSEGLEGISAPKPPRLFRAYLDISGRICGPPAIDRNFKTIDFLTVVDLAALPDRVRTRFF
jgi:putative hemolysin